MISAEVVPFLLELESTERLNCWQSILWPECQCKTCEIWKQWRGCSFSKNGLKWTHDMLTTHTWCLWEQYFVLLQPLQTLSPFQVPHQLQSETKTSKNDGHHKCLVWQKEINVIQMEICKTWVVMFTHIRRKY
jgi:hypothetical protein